MCEGYCKDCVHRAVGDINNCNKLEDGSMPRKEKDKKYIGMLSMFNGDEYQGGKLSLC